MWKEPGKEGGKKEDKDNREDGRRISVKKVLEVEESVWESRVREDAGTKALGLCNRTQGGACAKKRKGILLPREEREKVQAFMED